MFAKHLARETEAWVRTPPPPPVMLVIRVSSTIGGPGGVKPPIITA